MVVGLFELSQTDLPISLHVYRAISLWYKVPSLTTAGAPLPHGGVLMHARVPGRSAPIHTKWFGGGHRLAALRLRLGPLLSRGLLRPAQDGRHLDLVVLGE